MYSARRYKNEQRTSVKLRKNKSKQRHMRRKLQRMLKCSRAIPYGGHEHDNVQRKITRQETREDMLISKISQKQRVREDMPAFRPT